MAINTDENEGTNERERGQKERKRKANDVRPDARGIYVTAHSSAAITFCSGRCHQTIASASPLRVSGTQALIPTPDTCSGGRGAAQDSPSSHSDLFAKLCSVAMSTVHCRWLQRDGIR